MVKKYIPKQKDIVYLDFNLVKGHEQKGIRPAIVISNEVFNKFTKMAIVCPITSNTKDFPVHYVLKTTKKVNGSILCEHLHSINYEIRNLKYVEKCSDEEFEKIIDLINSFI